MGSSPPSPLSPSFSFPPISPPLSGSLMLKGRGSIHGERVASVPFFFQFCFFFLFLGRGICGGRWSAATSSSQRGNCYKFNGARDREKKFSPLNFRGEPEKVHLPSAIQRSQTCASTSHFPPEAIGDKIKSAGNRLKK